MLIVSELEVEDAPNDSLVNEAVFSNNDSKKPSKPKEELDPDGEEETAMTELGGFWLEASDAGDGVVVDTLSMVELLISVLAATDGTAAKLAEVLTMGMQYVLMTGLSLKSVGACRA